MAAPSADEDIAESDLLAAQGASKPAGSLVGRAIRATPGLAANVALAPFRFVWKVLRKNYTAEGLAKQQRIQIGDKTLSVVEYNETVTKKQKSLREKAEYAAETTYDYTEKTVFLPFRFVDSVIGLVLSPF